MNDQRETARGGDAPAPADYTAPSPADGPTRPAAPGIARPRSRPAPTRPAPTRPSEAVTEPAAPRPSGMGPSGMGPSGLRTGRRPTRPGRTRLSGTWIGLILGAVVLVLLLVFVLQNPAPADVAFLGWRATLPLGIWLLFAAAGGMLLLAIPGLGRMLQWRGASRPGRGRR